MLNKGDKNMKWLIRILSKSNRKTRGFTLIELMVVVIVVGILAAAAIPIYRFALSRAYSSEAKATMGTMLTSMKVFYAENNNAYPTFVFGESAETGGATADLMSRLGVDTDTNNWWHAGYEKGSPSTATCSFGATDGTTGAIPAFVSARVDLTGAGSLLIYAAGDEDETPDLPIENIVIVYDVVNDKWYTAF
jgi:prepilin-type N-terminal cleavage/methylation domain-containing protein